MAWRIRDAKARHNPGAEGAGGGAVGDNISCTENLPVSLVREKRCEDFTAAGQNAANSTDCDRR
jgi:hypothetical protein